MKKIYKIIGVFFSFLLLANQAIHAGSTFSRNKEVGIQQSSTDLPAAAQSSWNLNSLKIAVKNGDIETIEAAIDRGFNINSAIDENNKSLLWHAAFYGSIDVVQLLLERSAQVDGACAKGYTPLMIAAQEGYVNIVRLLLQYGTQIDAARNGGETSLMIAAYKGHLEIVRLLLEHGANYMVRYQKKSALNWAMSVGNHASAACIERHIMSTIKPHRECIVCLEYKATCEAPVLLNLTVQPDAAVAVELERNEQRGVAITYCCGKFICAACKASCKMRGLKCPNCRNESW